MTRRKLIEFELEDGSTVFFESPSDASNSGERELVSRDKQWIEKASCKYEDAIKPIIPAAEGIIKSFREQTRRPVRPDDPELSEICVEFGLRFESKARTVIASVERESAYRVSVKWKCR